MLDILYQDDALVVLDKPAGCPVHPSPGHEKGSLTDELVRLFPQMRSVGSPERPGVVHRLDIDTSGVIVFAKTQRAYLALRRAFESHREVEKIYLAVLKGAPKGREGTLRTLIATKNGKAKSRVVEPGGEGLLAVTHWRTLGQHGGRALVEFRIETGRTHQIRVHAAYLGHPIVGDTLYGEDRGDRRVPRMLLHAVQLSFPHPTTGRPVSFTAPPPAEIVYA